MAPLKIPRLRRWQLNLIFCMIVALGVVWTWAFAMSMLVRVEIQTGDAVFFVFLWDLPFILMAYLIRSHFALAEGLSAAQFYERLIILLGGLIGPIVMTVAIYSQGVVLVTWDYFVAFFFNFVGMTVGLFLGWPIGKVVVRIIFPRNAEQP